VVLIAKDDVQEREGRVYLRLGSEPLLLPEPLGALVRRLREAPPFPRSTILHSDSPWLFPGRLRGAHLSEVYMRERLWRLGIRGLRARSAAAMHLGQRVPAAILADLLGFSEGTAERWTQLAGGDWTRYAAFRAYASGPPHGASALRATAP
jgi:hypothetical protein